jgi:hypothetical protein
VQPKKRTGGKPIVRSKDKTKVRERFRRRGDQLVSKWQKNSMCQKKKKSRLDICFAWGYMLGNIDNSQLTTHDTFDQDLGWNTTTTGACHMDVFRKQISSCCKVTRWKIWTKLIQNKLKISFGWNGATFERGQSILFTLWIDEFSLCKKFLPAYHMVFVINLIFFNFSKSYDIWWYTYDCIIIVHVFVYLLIAANWQTARHSVIKFSHVYWFSQHVIIQDDDN